MAKNTGNTANVENVEVVVCKGHTVYHNGEKYGENQKLLLSQDDADSLEARGFVKTLADVLAVYERKQQELTQTDGGNNAG
ncbi:TPA: hypothetical protein I8Y21_003884 [Klebsiella oxytoca]|uniref:Uncharacterized protein n=1 Tax=Klebsiella oxytoca TaxID=571 RepID=A0AAN5LA52_KLEOX|nr:hypothetical protein [Klebsiella oxytoca]